MPVAQGSHNRNAGHTGLTQQECWSLFLVAEGTETERLHGDIGCVERKGDRDWMALNSVSNVCEKGSSPRMSHQGCDSCGTNLARTKLFSVVVVLATSSSSVVAISHVIGDLLISFFLFLPGNQNEKRLEEKSIHEMSAFPELPISSPAQSFACMPQDRNQPELPAAHIHSGCSTTGKQLLHEV